MRRLVMRLATWYSLRRLAKQGVNMDEFYYKLRRVSGRF